MKRRIGMDLDGVVYDWDGKFRSMVRHYFGINLKLADHWNSYKTQLGELGRLDIWKFMWDQGVKDGLFLTGDSYPGALSANTALAKKNDVVLITSRPVSARSHTFQWVGQHRIPTSEIHLVHDSPKTSVQQCDVYVDDGPHNVGELLAYTSAKVLLWDQPWNRGYEPDAVYADRFQRVLGWEDVLNAA